MNRVKSIFSKKTAPKKLNDSASINSGNSLGMDEAKKYKTKQKAPKKVQAKNSTATGAQKKPVISNRNPVQRTKNESPFVNLGPVSREFSSTTKLGNKRIDCIFDIETGEVKVNYSFSRQDGLVWGKVETLNSDEYMRIRNQLFNKAEEKSKWLEFVSRLISRLNINLSKSIPKINEIEVIKFVKSHLTPFEKVLIELSLDEWNRIDAEKLSGALQRHENSFEPYYAEHDESRLTYMKKMIDGSRKDVIETPPWNSFGIFSTTKATVMRDFKIENKISKSQADLIQSLSSLINADTDQDATEDEEDHYVYKNEPPSVDNASGTNLNPTN